MPFRPADELTLVDQVHVRDIATIDVADGDPLTLVEVVGTGKIRMVAIANRAATAVGPAITRPDAVALAFDILRGVRGGVPDVVIKMALAIIALNGDAVRLRCAALAQETP